jgi:hypothetical protein
MSIHLYLIGYYKITYVCALENVNTLYLCNCENIIDVRTLGNVHLIKN